MRAERVSTPSSPSSEELIVYGLLLLIGAIPVAITLFQHVAFGVEATLGLLMLAAGAVGVIAHLAQDRHGAASATERHCPEISGSRSR